MISDISNQEIYETMMKACDAKLSIPVRYGKVLFCGASAAGKSNFLNLLMKEDFQPLHISTGVLKPHPIKIAKAIMSKNDDDEVEFERMDIDDEILQLISHLPVNDTSSTSTPQSSETVTFQYTTHSKIEKPYTEEKVKNPDIAAKSSKLASANLEDSKRINLPENQFGKVWNMLTFIDTGGQPQFISMLPAVNSFAMITFIVQKMEAGALNKFVDFQYGNEMGEISVKQHSHRYTYLSLIKTLISYASNISLSSTQLNFLSELKDRSIETDNRITKSILLVGTHSGDNGLSEDNIEDIDKELTKAVEQSGVNHVRPSLNSYYKCLIPVDNKKQGKNSKSPPVNIDTRRYTKPSEIRSFIQRFLLNQDKIFVPIKWVLLELEIRKVCQNKKFISYTDVLKLAKEKKIDYAGEFGDDDKFAGDKFIKQGLRFHHAFGVLLYFEKVKGLCELVITDHQWLFNKLDKIVEYSFEHKKFDKQNDSNDLELTGIFKKTLLDIDCLDIKKDFVDSGVDPKIDPIATFLRLLEHLLIAAPLNKNDDKYFMPCILKSCELNNLKEKIPEYRPNEYEPLLIQFKSNDNETFLFPRGAFCFLVVELILSNKWKPYGQGYVNLLTLIKKGTAHYITLVDRIYCLEVHVTHKNHVIIHNEIFEVINMALHEVAMKIKIYDNLQHGFSCCCQLIEEEHISYLTEDSDQYCYCHKSTPTKLINLHKVWLSSNFNEVLKYIIIYFAYVRTYVIM